jgi:ribosome-interacting GTPase 1|tara:strand:- start:402 stop:773 length:372 start_codon:yes stop_codon:yes gene_type:complete
MADSGTLATTDQVNDFVGENASTAQALEATTNRAILFAESEIEAQLGDNIGIVANYASVTAANKQWLATVAAARAAFIVINKNQNSWQLATTQSKLAVCDGIWTGFLSDLKARKADLIADLGL